jgi:hypothetical protein
MKIECHACHKTQDEAVLEQCKVCHKYFCEDHAVQRSGVSFCSMGCAVYFFHVDPDDDDE